MNARVPITVFGVQTRRLATAIAAGALALLGCSADSGTEPAQGRQGIPQPGFDHVDGVVSGVALQVTGVSDSGRKFKGILTLTGAGFDLQVGPTLIAQLRGVLLPPADESDENEPTEDVSLNIEPIRVDYDRLDKGEDCIELEIQPPDAFDPETKQTVRLDAVRVPTRTLPGPGPLLADLICANDDIARSWEPSPNPV